MIKDKQMWDECAKECPGMNKGKIWSFEQIEQNRKMYENNKPLTKKQVLKLIEEE